MIGKRSRPRLRLRRRCRCRGRVETLLFFGGGLLERKRASSDGAVTRGGKCGDGSWDTLTPCRSLRSLPSGWGAIYNHKTNDLAILGHGAERTHTLLLRSDNDGVVGLHKERAAHATPSLPPSLGSIGPSTGEGREGKSRPSKRLERQRGHEPVRPPPALAHVPLLPPSQIGYLSSMLHCE